MSSPCNPAPGRFAWHNQRMTMTIFLLLVLFQIKHFLCDFPFQTPYMLGKFKGGTEWIIPLAAHATVHCAGTSIVMILWALATAARWSLAVAFLPLLDFVIHFTVDRIKASPAMGGRWKPDNRYFWWALGADQSAHHLTHYAIIWMLVR